MMAGLRTIHIFSSNAINSFLSSHSHTLQLNCYASVQLWSSANKDVRTKCGANLFGAIVTVFGFGARVILCLNIYFPLLKRRWDICCKTFDKKPPNQKREDTIYSFGSVLLWVQFRRLFLILIFDLSLASEIPCALRTLKPVLSASFSTPSQMNLIDHIVRLPVLLITHLSHYSNQRQDPRIFFRVSLLLFLFAHQKSQWMTSIDFKLVSVR